MEKRQIKSDLKSTMTLSAKRILRSNMLCNIDINLLGLRTLCNYLIAPKEVSLLNGNFENNERMETIRDLILEEEAVGETVIYKITVLQSVVEYERTTLNENATLEDVIIQELETRYPFSPRHRSQLNEGFFQFSKKNGKIDCYYIREMPFRWDYADTRSKTIQSLNVKRVDPAYRVRINISFEQNKVVLTFFGGVETLVFRAREIVCDAVKKYVDNFAKKDVRFSPEAMRNMLQKFGKYVELINIDPRDNEKFTKIVEQKVKGKAEVKKVIIYDVFNVRMTGISISISPEVARLIEEEGIRLTEIRGGLWLEFGIRITTRVKSNGRVEFIIPSKYFGNDEEKIFEVSVKLYQKLLPEKFELEKGPLERFM
jgi:hypothetical protein